MGLAAKPIYSSRADDLEFRESIDAFVVSVAERVDQLQDAECSGDWEELANLGRNLVRDAGRVGFDDLARSASVVAESCGSKDVELVRKRLVELTRISQCIRLGHRGAV